MLEMQTFARTDDFPSWFANAVQKLLSVAAFGFSVRQVDATHIQVPAGANDQAAALAVEGKWRWMEATVGPIAHPGGAAGTYPVFVTAKANNITNVPDPFTDHTDYTFGLVIEPPATTPTVVAGVVDIFEHVADVEWDGAKITRVDQLVPLSPTHAYRHAVGGPDPVAPADIGAATAVEAHAIESGLLKAGVLAGGDGVVTVPAPIAGPGATFNVTFAIAGGQTMWVKSAGGVLIPVTIPATSGAWTFSRPGSGNYRAVGLEVDTSGAVGFTAETGDEAFPVATAWAALPATTAGKVRIADIAIFYDGAQVSFIIRDRRPWARGAHARWESNGVFTVNNNIAGVNAFGNFAFSPNPVAMRIECTGAPIKLRVAGLFQSTVSSNFVTFLMDGVQLQTLAANALQLRLYTEASATPYQWMALEYEFTPSAGSHVFEPAWSNPGATAGQLSAIGTGMEFTVDETKPVANNAL